MGKKDDGFFRPFAKLEAKLRAAKPPPAKRGAPASAPPAPDAAPAREPDENELFRREVGAVEPVRGGRTSAPRAPSIDLARIRSEDDEALAQLAELVTGAGTFDLADSDEYLEGSAPGLDARVVSRLRRGEYAVQAHLDLHGLTRAEAKKALEAFVVDSQLRRYRCVLVVHGRGLHSKDQIPVLKESVQRWLSSGRLAQRVLAFTSARPHDGGAGAVYVLLRR